MTHENNKKYVFVPKDFEIPLALETDEFRLRMLCVEDVEKAYDADMSCFLLKKSLAR